MANVQICTHCGGNCTKDAKFCLYCNKAEKRRAMCEENLKLNPNYRCEMCNIGEKK